MSEWRLFEPGTIPEWTTPEWYAGRDAAPHVEQDAHRPRLEVAARFLTDWFLGREFDPRIVDLGAGDGGLFTLLPRHWRCRGYDLQPDSVRAAAVRGFDVRLGDVLELTPQEATADAVVCTEMIEHLLDPHAFVRQLRAWPIGYVVASSPATETDQAHYEYHCWAWDLAGYRALFEGAGFDVVRHETVGAFQVLGAVPR